MQFGSGPAVMGYSHYSNPQQLSRCGCWFGGQGLYGVREYMPQIDLAAHTTIMSMTSKTILKQTFINPSTTQAIDQASYTFPLYDGVSVVGFECHVGTRIIRGLVKEKEQARAEYEEAISRGETAGLLEQLPESSDVFTTRIGNIPAEEKVVVEITYLGELKHDAEVDGVRFTIPTAIAPRYGAVSSSQTGLQSDSIHAIHKGAIEITVDITVDEASFIRGIQSPSHPIGVTLGRTSAMAEDSTDPHRASATLSLGSSQLEKDFVLLVLSKDHDIPRALLETHPKFPNQRALMATLVPRFNLPPSRPEIVFVVDRSGSMAGKITTVISALKVFLKSLPVGVMFNICSFGSKLCFLWPRSRSYDKSSLEEALAHVNRFAADFGGTEMFEPVFQTVCQRYKDMELEVMVLTDGQIWQQQALFDFINKTVSQEPIRFFSLGIGESVSHSLVEGIARAGNGFAQFVGEHEKLDKKVVRMLKGALTPHIKDYTLEVKYEESIADGFEMVEKVTEGLRVLVTDPDSKKEEMSQKPTISLFDPSIKNEDEKQSSLNQTGQDRYSHLPTIAPPKLLQAPSQIPPLYPFIRTSAYLLMSSEACQKAPKSVVLRATSAHGPLELEIPVQDIGIGETIHQLAAKKAMTELEEGRGWIVEAKGDNDKKLQDRFDGRWDEIVQREAVRLGVDFQVGGKWCSFVAVQKDTPGVEQEAADLNTSATCVSATPGGPYVDYLCGVPAFNFGGVTTMEGGTWFMGMPGGGSANNGGLQSQTGNTFPSGTSFGASANASQAPGFATDLRHASPSLDFAMDFKRAYPSAYPVPGFGSVNFGGVQSQTANTSFGASGNASQVPGARAVNFGGVQSQTGNTSFGGFGNAPQVPGAGATANFGGVTGNMSFGGFGNASQVPGPGAGPFSVQLGGVQSQTGNTSFGGFGNASQVPVAGAVHYFGGVQSDTGNTSFGAFENASQVPGPRAGPFSVHLGGVQSQTGNTSFGAFGTSFGNASEVPAPGSVNLGSQSGRLQSQTGTSSFGSLRSKAPAKSRYGGSYGRCQLMSNTLTKRKNDMDVDMKADGIVRDGRMSTPQADFRKAEEFPWKSQRHETPVDRMHFLIVLQGFDGSWEWSDELLHVVGLTKEDVTSLHGDRATMATVLAVAFFERKVPGEKETWELVVDKARGWLEMRAMDVEVEVERVAAMLV